MDNITELIPFGHEQAISRKRLCTISGWPDRVIRRAIAIANEHGEIILNTDRGYFRYLDESDDPFFEHYIARERRRSKMIMRKIRKMEKSRTEELEFV